MNQKKAQILSFRTVVVIIVMLVFLAVMLTYISTQRDTVFDLLFGFF